MSAEARKRLLAWAREQIGSADQRIEPVVWCRQCSELPLEQIVRRDMERDAPAAVSPYVCRCCGSVLTAVPF